MLVLYGRAALELGYNGAPVEMGATTRWLGPIRGGRGRDGPWDRAFMEYWENWLLPTRRTDCRNVFPLQQFNCLFARPLSPATAAAPPGSALRSPRCRRCQKPPQKPPPQ